MADEKDKELIEEIQKAKAKIEELLEEYKFRDALFEVIDLSRKGNKYLQEKEPWIKAKQTGADGNTTVRRRRRLITVFTFACNYVPTLPSTLIPSYPTLLKKWRT